MKKDNQKLNNFNFYQIFEGTTPPFRLNYSISEPNWQIFKLYLDYILDYSESKKYHPVSGLLDLIIQAENLPIETRFQTACICVESILNSEFDLEVEIDKKLKEQIENINKHINENVEEKLKSRIQGLLAQLLNIRPKDKLYKLKSDNLIDERLIKDWEDLRNPIIHGEQLQAEKLQEYLNKYYSTLTLFYQLIFLKIGYIGKFSDYSLPNWPDKELKKEFRTYGICTTWYKTYY